KPGSAASRSCSTVRLCQRTNTCSHSTRTSSGADESGAVLAQLGGHQLQAQLVSRAPDPGANRALDQLRGHHLLEVRGARHRPAVELQDQVADPEAAAFGWAAGHDLDHLHAGAVAPAIPGAGRKRARPPGDAEEAAAYATLGHQGTDDVAGRRI